MITINDVKQISKKISLENGISENDLSEDVSEIVYRTDVFECDDASIIDRHIDIEYSFGDYYEVHEDIPSRHFRKNRIRQNLFHGRSHWKALLNFGILANTFTTTRW